MHARARAREEAGEHAPLEAAAEHQDEPPLHGPARAGGVERARERLRQRRDGGGQSRGSGWTLRATMRAGTSRRSAKAPVRYAMSAQRLGRPARQGGHAPQGAELATTTSSPGAGQATPAPASATRPATSWPSPAGSGPSAGCAPARAIFASVAQVTAASTSTTISPGPGRGAGTSSSRRSPGPCRISARTAGP